MTYALVLIIGLMILALAAWPILGLWAVIILLAAAVALAAVSLRQVPPINVAALTFLGKRVRGTILREGYKLLLPAVEDMIVQPTTTETQAMEFKDIRHVLNSQTGSGADPANKQSGGSSRAKVMLVYVPDTHTGERFNKFLDNGGRDGVNKIINGTTGGALRKAGGKKTFEEFAFSKSELTVELIEMMTGEKPEDLSEEGVKNYLADMLQNGKGDIQDLGITIRRIEVTEIDPEGLLEEDAEGAAREVQQRRTEEKDFDTEIALAQKYIDASTKAGGTPMTLEAALEKVRLRRNPNAKEVIVRGSQSPLTDAAAMLTSQPK